MQQQQIQMRNVGENAFVESFAKCTKLEKYALSVASERERESLSKDV